MFLIGLLLTLGSLIYLVYSLLKKNGNAKRAGMGILIGVILFIVGAMSEDTSTSEQPKETSTVASEENQEKPDDEEIAEEKTEYGMEEWWEVQDQWKLKIDSVRFTDERNQFSDEEPEAVVVIKYTYENLGYEDDIQDLFMTPDTVIDGQGKVVSTYPAGSEVSPKTTPVGATTEGAEKSYGLTSSEGDIIIHFNEYDDNSNKHKAIFVIPLPTE